VLGDGTPGSQAPSWASRARHGEHQVQRQLIGREPVRDNVEDMQTIFHSLEKSCNVARTVS
jgi:hypothetical protein